MIVSGGLGTSFIPARMGVPPEIVRVNSAEPIKRRRKCGAV